MLGLGTAILLVSMVVFSYTLLPGLIESRLAANLRESYGLEEEPTIEASSNFSPELLLGRIDRIEVDIDSFTKEGIRLRNLRIDLKDVDVSVPSIFRGNLEREIQAGSLVAEVPEESINEYLRENQLGLEGGEIDVRPGDAAYRSEVFGFPASVGLDLRVAGPSTIEVVPREVTVGGLPLPPFLTEPLTSGGRTLTVGELPLGAGLVDVEARSDELVIRAEK